MGRSKFPGKPSKLANKKRVSVLNNMLGTDAQGPAAGSGGDPCNSPGLPQGDAPPPDDDSDYAAGILSPSQSQDHSSMESCLYNKTTNNTSSSTTKEATDRSNNSSGKSGTNGLEDNQAKTADKPNPPDPPDPSFNTPCTSSAMDNLAAGILTRARKRLPIEPTPDVIPVPPSLAKPKKKTVTFKAVLETSDDVNIIKRVYNPDIVPVVPIIKISKSYDMLSRSERFARGDIVMPSRLTEVLKNLSANLDIDKLNQLTFKSTNPPVDAEDVHSQDGDDQRNTNDEQLNAFEYESGPTLNAGGDKKFVLPRRSAHSCRVIKPNKRFLDDRAKSVVGKLGRRASCSGKLQHTADNFIINTLSSQINKSKLIEADEWMSDTCDKEDNDANEVVRHSFPAASSSDDNAPDKNRETTRSHVKAFNTQPTPIFNPTTSLFMYKPSVNLAASKLILRQPRLTFQSTINDCNTAAEGTFSTNLNCIKSTAQKPTLNVCSVCLSPTYKCHQITRKFGFDTCETCRKFITKIIKNPNATNQMRCASGNCEIGPIPLDKPGHSKMFRSFIKERCSSCWLQKCLTISPDLQAKITTPTVYPISTPCLQTNIPSPFRIKTEHPETPSGTNIFANNSGGVGKLLAWPVTESNATGSSNDIDYRHKLSISNALMENNSTFGSSPLLKPMITEKPVIMINSATKETVNPIISMTSPIPPTSTVILETKLTKEPTEEVGRLRLRKKEISVVSAPSAITSESSSAASTATTTAPVSSATSETSKRQRIDLKGPRVKHVCRSASIVLGQPLATFPPDEASVLENMDTPPRPDSPNSQLNEMTADLTTENATHPHGNQSPCSDCKTISPLSPPTTPITVQNTEELDLQNQSNDGASSSIITKPPILPESLKSCTSEQNVPFEISKKSSESLLAVETIKPFTRKLARPIALSSSKVAHNITHHKNLNSFIRPKLSTSAGMKSVTLKPALIDIDFWENYDPAEVSQSGFGLILSECVSLRALCFLCGSSGQDPLMFCVCCCEPYHKYCVEDEYNLKSHSMDENNMSTLDVTTLSEQSTRLNWLCPRCTVCYSCNMASGSKVKCQKCQKNYHSTCLGTSKRLSGADRPLICAGCLKCKSCSTTNVSKFVGNLPMCSPCFRLRQKGNFCPLCQKCYEANDFNIKMMECGECRRWVHAKCEGLTDEQYNMLSVLPENIEFVCRKCAQNNSSADTWREAVVAEFRAGLLSVVRLLSKSRQACALLKLSPRKKSGSCVCQPVQSNRMIMFKEYNDGYDDSGIQDKHDKPINHCFCSASQPPVTQHITNLTLLEIKQKVQTNEYFSLADFNYDMNLITQAAACDELTVAYKEILSETFPWFQNETKACTDALEEDMYDSCDFNEGQITAIEFDQQVPGIVGIPEDIDDYFYESFETPDQRTCLFCKGMGEGGSANESRLLYCGQNGWVHTNCAMWSAEVFEEIDGSLQNVHSAISRGRLIKCSQCGSKGATVGCNLRSCGEHYHYPCAKISGCVFLQDKSVYCPLHISEADRQSCALETNFEVIRPVYVELDRKKKKCVAPGLVQFIIGSLHVKQLGKVLTKLSDHNDVIVPADFRCTRLYWSTKEPWKIVEYSVRTFVQNNNQVLYQDLGKNMVVDHGRKDVFKRLAQITKWHKSLINGASMDEYGTDSLASSDETNEDEPQNNANDLLPPEIKDAIFEDLPHDILDGISMLDIFPMDSRNEQYLNSDMSEMDDDFCDSSTKDYFGSSGGVDSWSHVEDALLSAATSRPSISSRELKRSKSEMFAAVARSGSMTSRANHRSSSFSWNSKIDSNSMTAKRRKVTRIDLRLSEGMLLSVANRPKLDFSSTVSERVADEKNRTSTWNSSKISALNDEVSSDGLASRTKMEKLKISQLDGVDDLSSGSESGSPLHESISISYDHSTRESPVKCDRCHCTYRTFDSYHRHLPTCEPLSTSESESEHTTHAADMQSPPQNVIITSMNGPEFCNLPIMQQQSQLQQPQQQIFNLNGQQISLQNIPTAQPMQINQPIPTNGQMKNQTIHTLQNQMQNVILNPTNGQQMFATSSMQPQIYPIQNVNQTHFTTQDFQKCSPQPQTINLPNGISLQAAQPTMMQNQTQPQLLTISQQGSNGTHLLQIAPNPVHSISGGFSSISSTSTTTSSSVNRSSTFKKQLILPQPDKSVKRSPVQNILTSGRGISVKRVTKPVQIKQNIIKNTEQQQQQQHTIQPQKPMQMFGNQNMPIMRTTAAPNEIVLQQATGIGTQPMLMQQLGGGATSNLVQYIGDNGQIHYIALPAQHTDFKHPQQPSQQPFAMTTANPMLQGGYQFTTDASGNLILANNTAPTLQGLQMLPNGTLQLTSQPQQPQVIGTIIQNQPNGMMMGTDQLAYANQPTLEMITNPATGGCMLVTTNQPMYYGLETIVQNTVMSSQQFVSSAMQGVLSQNSSFSATTTQVFQASKIEPIMEMPGGYVVLNNDGTIMQPQPHQNIMGGGVQMQPSVPQLQTALPQIQNQAQSMINPSATQSWRFLDDKSSIQLMPQHQTHGQTQSSQQPTHHIQQHPTAQTPNVSSNIQPSKQNKKSPPIAISKIQPQNIQYSTSVHATSPSNVTDNIKQNSVILPKTMQSIASIDGQHYIIQNQQTGNSPATIPQYKSSGITVQPIQRKTNMIRPIAATPKVSNTITKPKVAPRLPTKVQSIKSHPKAATISAKPVQNCVNIQHIQSTSQIALTEQRAATQKKPGTPCPSIADLKNEFKSITSFSVKPSMDDSTKVNTYTLSFTTTDPSCSASDTNHLNTPTISCHILSGPSSLSSGSLSQAQPFYSSATTHATITPPAPQFTAQTYTQNNPTTPPTTIISLPTASIQLPTAPYAPSYSNGIPTNVVNPIQQPQQYSSGYISNTSSTTPTISRPTNRVLPMQTQQPSKTPVPPTPSDVEPKMLDTIPIKKIINIDTSSQKNTIVIEQDHSPNQLVIVEEKHDDEDDLVDQTDCTMEMATSNKNTRMDIDEIDISDDTDANTLEVEPSVSADELFDKLKSETNDLLIRIPSTESKPDVTLDTNHGISEPSLDETDEKTMLSSTEDVEPDGASHLKSSFDQTPIVVHPTITECDLNEQNENINPTNVLNESSNLQKRPLKCMLQEQPPTQSPTNPTQLKPQPKPTGPKMLYEIQSQDGFTYKSTSVTEIWEKVFEAVQVTRKAHGLAPLPDGPLADMCGHQMLGLKTNALKYLVEQLPGVEKCIKYQPKYHKRQTNSASFENAFSSFNSDSEEFVENPYGAARVEGYSSRSEYDMFSWLASRHRKQPNVVIVAPNSDNELIPRRGTGSNLPMAMRYRTLKETYKETVGVYRSHIHGRGLFCNRDIEAGEMVIEYAGELIRSTLTDKRERYYDGRGIGCYMFKIDENLVVDATMRGNAARFINHACEPNCYSKVVDILGHKHIIIFALRRIVQGEELTYDYKFPFEETKIPCSCGSRKCRKYLN